MRYLSTTLLSLSFGIGLAQNNALVIHNDAYVVLDGGSSGTPINLVIDQSNKDGIVTSGTGGNIISEGEYNYVKWNVGTGTGNYVIPWTTGTGAGETKIPLALNVTGAGVGSGYIAASTYETSSGAGQYDNTPWPAGVVHMAGGNGAADNSDYTVDRFWIIDADDPYSSSAYTTKPTLTASFGYNTDADETGDGNLLSVGNLGAQRYNFGDDKWYGYQGAGMVWQNIWGTDNAAGTVSGVSVTPGIFDRVWTLADKSSPLPIDLIEFNGACEDAEVELSWATASELNNDYFIIQKSTDGVDFEDVAVIYGAGTSTSLIEYDYTDDRSIVDITYYQLLQVDYDGHSMTYDMITVYPCGSLNTNGFVSNEGDLVIDVVGAESGDVEISLVDMSGKLIIAPETFSMTEGSNRYTIPVRDLAFGIYNCVVRSNDELKTFKFNLK